jgi:serine kinase of HPr protein (carbohydrate metabolism regulator)
MMFAPRGTEIGSMVDILGVGVIIRGESGIGKSEAVLALIERGYSLVADDVTKVTLVDGREVIGTSAELTRNHMEVRGIGIINVAAMFGVKSIRKEKTLDLVVTPQGLGRRSRRGPRRHGTGICENPGRGHSAHHHSRAARTRPGAADRSRRVPDQVENVRPQRRQGIERPAHRADEFGRHRRQT